jgi:hypothetical protein
VKEHPNVIRQLIMSDDSHLELSGCVNKQNVRYWSEAIRMKCMWYQCHWPIFLVDETGSAVTETSDRSVVG